MKIVAFSTYYYPHEVGGGERSLRLLLRGLSDLGCDCCVVAKSLEPLAKSYSIEQDGKIKVIRLSSLGLDVFGSSRISGGVKSLYWHLARSYSLTFLQSYKEVLNLLNPDVILLSGLNGFFVQSLALVLKKYLVVSILRDYYFVCPRNSLLGGNGEFIENDSFLNWLITFPRRRLLRSSDLIVANSRATLDIVHKFAGFDKRFAKVVYTPPGGNERRRRFPKSSNEVKKVLYIGALTKFKGVDRLCDFLRCYQGGFSFVFAGEGPLESQVRTLSLDHSNVEFVGRVEGDAKEKLFCECDAMVVPSYWHEPLPRTIWEAFDFGLVVVASSVGGIPEQLGFGKRGILFDWRDSESLPNALLSLSDESEVLRLRSSAMKYLNEMRLYNGPKVFYKELLKIKKRDFVNCTYI